MTSTCNDVWLTDIARREFAAGFVDGALLGAFVVSIIVAVVVTYAFSEVETK